MTTHKTALITGASKGIGKALAEVFAKHHYSLILIARTTSELESLQTDLKNRYQCDSKILSVDLSHPDCVATIMKAFKEEIPKLDVLINNAGFGIAKRFAEMREVDVHDLIAVNIKALTDLTYAVLPHMINNRRGKILNVSSIAAYTPGPYMAMYYASKAYVLSFSESLYEETRKHGVLVSVLCPGVTKSSFHKRSGHTHLMSGFIRIMSAESVATMGYEGIMKNKRVIITGWFNKFAVLLMNLIPRSLLMKVTAMMDL